MSHIPLFPLVSTIVEFSLLRLNTTHKSVLSEKDSFFPSVINGSNLKSGRIKVINIVTLSFCG